MGQTLDRRLANLERERAAGGPRVVLVGADEPLPDVAPNTRIVIITERVVEAQHDQTQG